METQDLNLRTNEVVKEVINGVEVFTYKGIEIDRNTWESASCPMFCDKNNRRQYASVGSLFV